MRWLRAAGVAAAATGILAWWWSRPPSVPGPRPTTPGLKTRRPSALPVRPAPSPAPDPAPEPEAPAPAVGPPPLRGRVVDARTGQPVAGAAVRLCEKPPPPDPHESCPAVLAETESGDDGSFALDLPAADDDEPAPLPEALVALADGYTRLVVERARLDLHGRLPLALALQPNGHLFGRVLRRDGSAVAGAEVGWSPGREPGVPQQGHATAEDGAYDLPDLPAGDLVLLARSSEEDAFVLVPLSLHGGEARALDLVLEDRPVLEIRGRLVDGAGAPLAFAEITVHAAGAALSPLDRVLVAEKEESEDTDVRGGFSLRLPSPGPYDLAFYPPAGRQGDARPLVSARLSAAPDPEPVTLVASGAATIACTLVDADGQPSPIQGFGYSAKLGAVDGEGGGSSRTGIGVSISGGSAGALDALHFVWPTRAVAVTVRLMSDRRRRGSVILHGPADPCRAAIE